MKGEKSALNIKLPIQYREKYLSGTLHHEIGTHLIRTLNNRKQRYHKIRTPPSMREMLESEEGLACVNQLIDLALDKE